MIGSLPGAVGRQVGGPPITARARRQPYVRLALNGSFSALWVGQLISLFGDRVHQVALAFLVLRATNSALAIALVFLAASLPNLVLGPVAGTFVDRWDHQEVMVVSDLLRGAIVLLLPDRGGDEPRARLSARLRRHGDLALLPAGPDGDHPSDRRRGRPPHRELGHVAGRHDGRHHRLPAGRPVRGLPRRRPRRSRSGSMPATYVASALLIASMAIPPLHRAGSAAAEAAAGMFGRFVAELREGWDFLRHETVLLANTLQATVAQFTLGVACRPHGRLRQRGDPARDLGRDRRLRLPRDGPSASAT